jgi:hypothetical protein
MTRSKLKLFSKAILLTAGFGLAAVGVADAHPGHNVNSYTKLMQPAAFTNAPTSMKAAKVPAKKQQPSKANKAKQLKNQRKGFGLNRRFHRAEQVAKYDADGSGKLEKDERLAIKKQRFAMLDANSDGLVTLEELQNFMQPKGKRAGKGNGKLKRKMKAKRHKLKLRKAKREKKQARFFTKLDADQSGALTLEEFSSRGLGKGKRGKRGKGSKQTRS